ncbi:hypothetical protein [Hymenobacter sp. BT491]|uniref:hypothetical protein n=1 Tax=Hymenobacter sp. BT491 TaxID=2766779 RepID=UPI001653647D|nr:hypothetical protein [Hymenobacter sp. BT491]MBC6988577.1 hypothetical protein [Hymenobacter sp. BT491]
MATQKMTVERWLEITLSNLREQVIKQKVRDTDELLDSIKGQLVAAADGDVERLSIAYALYGKFADMGVGRGMGAGVRKSNSAYTKIRDAKGQLYRYSRKKRQWYSKEMGRQTMRLSTLLSEFYGDTMIAMAQDAVPGTVEINL